MHVTREIFEQQWTRRFGRSNPERMCLEHWEWMVRTRKGPYWVRRDFDAAQPLPMNEKCGRARGEPGWCFERYGMSRTALPDGRIVCIAGEHEDSYDPDFCIYNDVVVLRPASGQADVTVDSGAVEIYGYPQDAFPPTDFHTATPIEKSIYVIGSLGYAGARRFGTTPVFTVDTASYAMAPVATTGPPPGWIYDHHASFDAGIGAILVRGGEILCSDTAPAVINRAAHRFDVDCRRWSVISQHEQHRAFLLRASDRRHRDCQEPTNDAFRLVRLPYLRLKSEDRGFGIVEIDVRGVRVRFELLYDEATVLVEGDLPAGVVDMLLEDVMESLTAQTGAEWYSKEARVADTREETMARLRQA